MEEFGMSGIDGEDAEGVDTPKAFPVERKGCEGYATFGNEVGAEATIGCGLGVMAAEDELARAGSRFRGIEEVLSCGEDRVFVGALTI